MITTKMINEIKKIGLAKIDKSKHLEESYKELEPLVIKTINRVLREQSS